MALVWGRIGLAHSCIYTNWQITFKTSSIFSTYLLVTFTVRVHWNLAIPVRLNDKEVSQKVIRDGLSHFSKIKIRIFIQCKPTAKTITLHCLVLKEIHPSFSHFCLSVLCLIVYLCARSSGAQHATTTYPSITTTQQGIMNMSTPHDLSEILQRLTTK